MYFLLLEAMQLKVKGFKDYFYEDYATNDLDTSNIVDILSIIFGLTYIVLRVLLYDNVKCFMITQHSGSEEELMEFDKELGTNVMFIILTIATMLLSVWRIMNFLRLSTEFGQLV